MFRRSGIKRPEGLELNAQRATDRAGIGLLAFHQRAAVGTGPQKLGDITFQYVRVVFQAGERPFQHVTQAGPRSSGFRPAICAYFFENLAQQRRIARPILQATRGVHCQDPLRMRHRPQNLGDVELSSDDRFLRRDQVADIGSPAPVHFGF